MKAVGRWLTISVAGCLLFLSILFALAQTEVGKREMAKLLAESLSKGNEARAEVGKIAGLIPFEFQIDRLALSDAEGRWLTIEKIALRWSPFAVLRGRVHIDEFTAAAIQLDRLPPAGKDGEERSKELPIWPSALQRLSVDCFAVDQLTLGRAVLGESAVFKVEAQLMASIPGDEQLSFLRVQRTDGPKAGAVVTARVKGEQPEIAVDAQLAEASGGLVAQSLGCEGPVVLTLHGKGPVQAWKGKLNAEVGGIGHLQSVLEVKARNDLRIIAEGTFGLASEFLPAALAPSLGTESRFAVDMRLLQTNEVILEHLRLKTIDGVDLQLAGSLDLKDQTTRSEFAIRCDDLASIRVHMDSRFGGSLVVKGNLSGPLLQPQTILSVKSQDIALANIRAAAMDANLKVECLAPMGSPLFGLRVIGTGDVKDFTVETSRLPANTAFSWTLKAEGSLERAIHISELRLVGEEFALDLSGVMHPAGLTGVVETALEIEDLRWLSGLLGIELPAGILLQAVIDGDGQTRSLSAQIQGKINILDQVSPPLVALLGSQVSYTGKVMVTGAKKLTVSELAVDAVTAKLTGAASLDFRDDTLEGSWHLVMPELVALAPILKRSLGGWLQVDGELQGPLTMLKLNAEATGRNILFEGWEVQGISAKIRAHGLPSKSLGDFQLELKQAEQKLMARANFDIGESSVTFSDVSVEAGENELTGRFTLDLKSYLMRGGLQGKCKRLSDLSPFIREGIAGSAELKSQFEIVETSQKIDFKLKGIDVKSRFGEADSLLLQGRLTQAFTDPQGTTELELDGFRLDDLSLASLMLRVEGNGQQMSYAGRATGRYKEDFDIQASGLVAITPKSVSLKVNRFQASYSDLPLTIARPVSILRTSHGYTVEGLTLNLGEGHLEGSWRSEEKAVTLRADFEGLPLEAVRLVGAPDLAGTLTGSIRLHAQADESAGGIELRLDGLRIRDPKFQCFPATTLATRAELQQGRLHAALSLQGLEEPVEVELEIPIQLSVSPFTWWLPPQGEVRGALAGEIDLAWIPLLLSLDSQSIEGRFKVSLGLGGTVNAPEIRGEGRIEKGSYENVRSGTVLKDINLEIVAETPRLSIRDAHASDGEEGIITAAGWIDLLPNKDFPFNVDVVLERAKLIRLDNATATGGGQLKLSGSLGKVLLAGQLECNQAELRIPHQVSAEVVELEVIEIHGVSEERQVQRAQSRTQEWDFQFDMKVVSPGRVFLRGRGLDSEWQGDLRITGKASEPVLTGRFSVVRGHFNFLGKRFGLIQGLLLMDGRVPPSPHLDVVGEASGKDMIARLKLFGSALEPDITLNSEPELPSDEILSRLLFGRSVSEITPVQAVRLAYAAKQLTGGGGGFDFMGGTRRLIGVDQLEIKQSGENSEEPAISAGKYLSEGVYLEVEKGAGRETGKTSVEVEITPNVTLETEIGENAQGGVGLNWKLNY